MPTFRQDEKLGTKVPLIKTADFNDKSVTTEKLAEGSVTNSKLAPESVTQDKFDKELLQIFEAAAGLPENLIETIQNIDSTLVDYQRQISSNDDDISDLQTKTKQIKDTVDGIAISGGASVGSAVTYDNTQSGLDALNIQNAIDELVNNLGHYETNEEWLRAYTDAENKFLWGIRIDGSIDWAIGIPRPIQKKIEELIATDTAIQESITQLRTELTESLNKKIQSLKDNEIKNLQDTKVDKEEGKSLIEDEVKECFRVIENEEFLKAIVDSDDKVLFGLYRATGKPYYPQNDMYHISQSEEFLWVILDAANHPLLGIQQDGTCWAAKAQWLDDIKAIKEALKTFQPKEDGKGLINLDVADGFFYISNDEYIIAVVDVENRILAGIKYDGNPYFPNHEMYSVITDKEWLYAILDAENKVLCGFRVDDGHMFVGGIDISTFITNAIIDIADIKERTAHLSTIETDEYISVETDVEGKVIGYIAPDGSHYLYKLKSETIPTEFEHIEDPEGRTEITTDSEGKVMSYRDSEGKKHEHDMEVSNLEVSNLNLRGNSVNNIQDALKANGFTTKSPMDWSENTEVKIPEPYCAYANITGDFPEEKGNTTKGVIEFYDMQGNYFKKFIEMDIHGRTSAVFKKKNYTFDFFNDKDHLDPFTIKFGDWVSMDSYYFQGWYTDSFRGIDIIAYKLYQQITETRGYMKDKPFKYNLLENVTSEGNEESKNVDVNLGKNALCTPMGFPVILFHNNEFYGIYTVMLKKNRANFLMDKKNYKAVLLDLDQDNIIRGDKKWNSFEIRNPKTLICMDGSKYDGDNPKELIDDTSANYDASNKDMENSFITKKAILNLANAYLEIQRAISEKKTNEEIKTLIESNYNVDFIVDYILFSNIIENVDGWGGNWQWSTWDGIKWNPNPYDLNAIFGLSPYGMTGNAPSGIHTSTIASVVYTYYIDDIKKRYKELRDKSIISVENIIKLFKDWTERIGTDNYKKEFSKWNTTPSQRDSNLNSEYWDRASPERNYFYFSPYNNGTKYNANEVVWGNDGKLYKSLMNENIGNPTSDTTKWECITYDMNKEYEVGDTCYYIKNVAIMFKCKKRCMNQPPVTSVYDEPYGIYGFYDSIGRICQWVTKKIEILDNLFN